MSTPRELEIAALISPFNGRWPTQDDKERMAFNTARRTRPDAEEKYTVRWMRWSSPDSQLEVAVGPPDLAIAMCPRFFMYLPACVTSPPLLFASAEHCPQVAPLLEQLSSRSATLVTPLSVMVDQAVSAFQAAGGVELQKACASADNFSDVFDALPCFRLSTDLLLCLTLAACRSLRKVTLFDPFPAIFLDSEGFPDFDACRMCIDALPPLKVRISG